MTILHSKHLPESGSAVCSIIGYGWNRDGVASVPWVAWHASISILCCCLPLLNAGCCGIAVTCSSISSFVRGAISVASFLHLRYFMIGVGWGD